METVMPKHYDETGNMPNNSKSNRSGKLSDTDSGSKGSNKGATGGLTKSNEMRSDVTKTPNTKNMYPDGLA